jgi:protoheme IX farnesyltransferase
MGWLYLLGAIAGGAYFLSTSVRLWLAPGRANARANFRASLVQLTLLLVMAIADAGLVDGGAA